MTADILPRVLVLVVALALGAAREVALDGALEEGAQAAGDTAPASQEADLLGVRLVTHPACAADIHRLCAEDNSITLNDKTPNLDVISCLLDRQEEDEDAGVSQPCHHVLWQLRHNLTRSASIVRAVGTLCPNEKFADCDPADRQPGHYISCVMEHMDNVEDDGCADFLENLGMMVFSDYRMIYKFAEDCSKEIDNFQCGRLEDDDEKVHSQGKTIECVSSHMDELEDPCKLQVLRVAELQAEDYHRDRPLYFACREDRERFCASTVSGNGKVYQCLLHHKMEKDMSKKCRKQLTRRQKMTSVDYKVSKRLRKACKQELADSDCHQAGGHPADTDAAHSLKLAFVLLCLDDHQKQGHPVSGECVQEIVDHRRALMEDYTLSPELVNSCAKDIGRLCQEVTQQRDGQVIHCLMMYSNPAKVSEEELVSAQCQRQVEDLLRVADVAEEWKVDPVLQKACAPVVSEACSDVGNSEGAVLSCLAEALDSDAMTAECEQVLLQIQYFVSRDFKLDPQLYKLCHEDAQRLCSASDGWWQQDRMGASNDPMVLPCLYRNAFHPEDTKPADKMSGVCRSAVRRVMKYRSDEVDLHPEIQDVCMSDLAKLCSEHIQRGREITCLQDNYTGLQPQCQKVIKSLIQDEARYVELNPEVARVCKHVIKQYCMAFVESGGVMECLIQHKSDPDVRQATKCWAAINHFQLISIEDYTFSYKFKQHCHEDVALLCRGMEKKADVIRCLSGAMLNDTMAGAKQRVSKECRRQVQSQLWQREENVELDPRLITHCGRDIHQYCLEESESKGSGKVLECLRGHVSDLSKPCKKLLFRRQQQSLILPKADYFLFNACKGMILKYCSAPERDASGSDLLDCLKAQTEEPSFDPTCSKVVSRRLAEQKRDYRLHPALREACQADALQHCAPLLADSAANGLPQQGRVTACLADAFRRGQVSSACGRQLDLVLREAARDVHQDPLLAQDCHREIGRLCAGLAPDAVGECLRQKLADGEVMGDACARRVARIVEDVNVDVHTDPQLSTACALDLQRHCSHVPIGNGAQMTCLTELKDPTVRCATMLTLRMKMMKAAMKVRPAETVQELYTTVRDSPSRDYFVLLVFGILVIMFFGGLCCGRATKRAKYIQKMK